jgi:hypothetical protein
VVAPEFPALTWEALDWQIIERLRTTFLAANPQPASYWNCRADLEHYEFTFGQRVAWKWDAVLRELRMRGWTPPAANVLDWGCGSGIASRRVIEFFGPEHFKEVRLYDRSPLAMEYAAKAARQAFPLLRVECSDPGWLGSVASVGVLVISHVLSELNEAGGRALRQALDKAEAVLWVEPGTHADSRALMAIREELHPQFTLISPCTHQAACGLLAAGNERHWCHHFARMPPAIMADADWVRFAQRAGIDLRSLPYSCLVLERHEAGANHRRAEYPPSEASWSRIVGVPRFYKAFARILSCQVDGVRELVLQKRDEPALFKQMKETSEGLIYRWNLEDDRIKTAEAIAQSPDTSVRS